MILREGCNHVVCACEYQFCYKCFGDLRILKACTCRRFRDIPLTEAELAEFGENRRRQEEAIMTGTDIFPEVSELQDATWR